MKKNKCGTIDFILMALCAILFALVVTLGLPMLLEIEFKFITSVVVFDVAFCAGVVLFTKLLKLYED